MMIVTVLLGLFMSSVFDTVLTGLRLTGTANDRERIRQEMSAVVDRMTREIAVADNVDNASNTRFQFDTVGLNNINYQYSSGSLTRSDANTSSTTILRSITAFDFDYWDDNNTQIMTDPVPGNQEDNIRVVQVTITVTRNNETMTLASAAFLRSIQ